MNAVDQYELQWVAPYTYRTVAHRLGVARWEAWRPGGLHVACLVDADVMLTAEWVMVNDEIGVQLVDPHGTVHASVMRRRSPIRHEEEA